MTIAAAVLFLLQETATSELLAEFLKGSAPAREALRRRGPDALLHLLEARRTKPDRPRAAELDELVFDLQEAAAGERGKPVFRKLRDTRLTIDMQGAPLSAVLDYLREISELSLAVDPGTDLDKAAPALALKDSPLKDVLRTLCARIGLDFDFRYGLLYFAPHERLWAAPRAEPAKPLSPEQSAEAQSWIAKLSAESVADREAATAGLRRLGPAVAPLIEEGARGGDAERAARCRTLADELRPRPRTWGALPPECHWRSQKLEGADLKIAEKLQQKKLDLAFENGEFADILLFIGDFSGIPFAGGGALPKSPITLKLKDRTLGEVLELLTLPRGLDVRIESGQVTIFERKK